MRRWLKDPGLRAKLPEKYLSSAQRSTRQMNTRLAQPIVPGSTTTERDLAREAQAAMGVQFGDVERQQQRVLGEEKQRQVDMGGFYDDYLGELERHRLNSQQIGQAAGQQMQNMQAGVTGLAAADLTQLNQAATKDAEARGATPGDLAQMASNAAAVRQGLVGSFVARQANENAAQQGAASLLSRVVGPGQKLWAQARGQGRIRQAEEDITGTAAKRGAADVQYRAGVRGEEAKNVLARQVAGLEAAETKAKLGLETRRVTETERANRADETAAERRAREKREADALKDAEKSRVDAAKGREPNKYGIPADQWARWSTSHRQREMDKFNKSSGSRGKPVAPAKQYEEDFYRKYGVKPANTQQTNKAQSGYRRGRRSGCRASEIRRRASAQAGQSLTTGQAAKGKDSVAIPTPSTRCSCAPRWNSARRGTSAQARRTACTRRATASSSSGSPPRRHRSPRPSRA